jgi:hypothetical protein
MWLAGGMQSSAAIAQHKSAADKPPHSGAKLRFVYLAVPVVLGGMMMSA